MAIELGWPAKALNPNSRDHYMAVARFKKATKDTAFWATRAVLGRNAFEHGDAIPVRIIAHPPDKRARDADNLISSMKAALDGIALGLGVNDKLFSSPVVEWADPVSSGKVIVVVGDGE